MSVLRQLIFAAAMLAPAARAQDAAPRETYAHGKGWTYWRLGNPADVTTATHFGIAFEGGGTDVKEVYRFLCQKSGNGDVLVLRASGTPDYNPYIRNLCPAGNSAATLKIYNRAGALDPFVAKTIAQAEAIFIAGGDQGQYVRFWQGTPVQQAINDAAARGVPVGGTSAGNAILARYAFSALHDTIFSGGALFNCGSPKITIDTDFLSLSRILTGTVTDDHFVTRNRMGRLMAFLANIAQGGVTPLPVAIAGNEHAAFLMEPDGSGRVVGGSHVYFLRTTQAPGACGAGVPLTYGGIQVYRAGAGATFDLRSWTGQGGTAYTVSANAGQVTSTQPNGKLY